jgi:GTP cyclohydrolase III
MDGKSVIGIVSRRSGGGWIATIPVFGVRDNGITDTRIKIGTAIGRGQTPAEALEEADRRALEGITGYDDYTQEQL